MRHAALLGATLTLAGCDTLYPEPVPLGQKQLSGYYLATSDQPGFSSTFYGYMAGSDARGHFSLGWTDSPGGDDFFSGTVTTDGAFDPTGTFAHTGQENLQLAAPDQISFGSKPGRSLHGIEIAAPSDVIYVDLRMNKSHVGVNVDFIALASNCYPSTVNTARNPMAFTTDHRTERQNSSCSGP